MKKRQIKKQKVIIRTWIDFNEKAIIISAFIGFIFFIFAVLWNFLAYFPWVKVNEYPNIYYPNGISEGSFLWFNFFHFFTTQSNIFIFICEGLALYCWIFKSHMFKKFDLFAYATAYISITFLIFNGILLPGAIATSYKEIMGNWNLMLYLPWTIALHIICPISMVVLTINLYSHNKNLPWTKKSAKYYIIGMIYPLIYMTYLTVLPFVKIDDCYHTVYGNLTNFNSDFYYSGYVEDPNASYDPGNPVFAIMVPASSGLFLFMLWWYQRAGRYVRKQLKTQAKHNLAVAV